MIEIPFDDNFSENQDKFPCHDAQQPCVICGRACKNPRYMVRVHDGYTKIVTEEEAERMNTVDYDKYADDMGMHPIGPDCLRKHPEIRPYVHDSQAKAPKKPATKAPSINWRALYFDLYRQVNGESTPDSEVQRDAKKRAEILKCYS